MLTSPAGQMIKEIWNQVPLFYPDVDIDAFIVMPNHIHGIIVLPSTDSDLFPERTALPRNPVGATPCGCPSPQDDNAEFGANLVERASSNIRDTDGHPSPHQGQPQGVAPTGETRPKGMSGERLSLPDVVHRFKTLTTYRYGEGVKNDGWQRYKSRLWQRNYYERVVRNEVELARFRAYIESNPARWFEDPYRA